MADAAPVSDLAEPATRRQALPSFSGLGILGLVWGSSFLFIRLAVVDLGPGVTVFGRCLVASLALGAVLAVRRRSPVTASHRRRLHRYLGMAVLNGVIPWLCLAYAELTVSSGLTSIVNATTPLWAAVLAWWVTPGERPGAINYAGVGLGFAGVVALVVPELIGRASNASPAGLGIVLVAALSYAAASLYQRRWLRDDNPVDSGFWQMALTAVVTVPLAAATVPAAAPHWSAIAGVVALGLGASCAGIVIYYWLLNTVGAAGAASVNYLLPVTALVWGVLFLREAVTAGMVLAAAAILLGVLLTSLRPGRRRQATRSGMAA